MKSTTFLFFIGLFCFHGSLFSSQNRASESDDQEYTKDELQKILDENLDSIISLLDDDKKDGIETEKNADSKDSDDKKDREEIESVVEKDLILEKDESDASKENENLHKEEVLEDEDQAMEEDESFIIEEERDIDNVSDEKEDIDSEDFEEEELETEEIASEEEELEEEMPELDSEEDLVPTIDIKAIKEDHHDLIDGVEDEELALGGAGAGALATVAVAATQAAKISKIFGRHGKDISDNASEIKEISKSGTLGSVEREENRKQRLSADIKLQEDIVDKRREQEVRKLDAYEKKLYQPNKYSRSQLEKYEKKRNKWAGRSQQTEEMSKNITEQKSLQERLSDSSLSDDAKKLTHDQQVTLAKNVYDREKQRDYARLDKYEKKGLGLTRSEDLKKSRTQQMLDKITARERQLIESQISSRSDSEPKEKSRKKNIMGNAGSINRRVGKIFGATAGAAHEMDKVQSSRSKKTSGRKNNSSQRRR